MIKKKSNKDIPSEAKRIAKRLMHTNLEVENEYKYQDMLLQERKRLDAGKTIEPKPSTQLNALIEKRQMTKEEVFSNVKAGPAAPKASVIQAQSFFKMPDHWSRLVCCLEEYTHSTLGARYYLDLLEGTGYSGTRQLGGLNEKQASGFAGSATLSGPNAHSNNRVILGFGSGLTLTGTGREIIVTVLSQASVNYEWLEAQSFSIFGMGHVEVISSLNVTVYGASPATDTYYYDAETLINAYATVENPWHPTGINSSVIHAVEFTITLPPGVSRIMDIYETIDLRAMRYGMTDRCNAVVQCSATFAPVVVNVFKKC